jgi:hypothetical protein
MTLNVSLSNAIDSNLNNEIKASLNKLTLLPCIIPGETDVVSTLKIVQKSFHHEGGRGTHRPRAGILDCFLVSRKMFGQYGNLVSDFLDSYGRR